MATAATSGVITHTYSYNAGLHETSDAMTVLFSNSKTLSRGYDTATGVQGRPTGISIASEYSVAYGFDSSGRLNSVAGPGLPGDGASGTGAVYKFMKDGQNNPLTDLVSEIDFNTNGPSAVATTTRAFEDHRDLLTQVENKWGSVSVSKYVYRNDVLGRRTDMVMSGSQTGASRLIKFGYDDRNDLTTNGWYNGQDPDNPGSPVSNRLYGYRFDCIGNRTIDTGDPDANTTGYTSNALNQYTNTTSPSETFSYDADGNLTQDGTNDYVYDADNRLIAVTPRYPSTGSFKLALSYDHLGRRVRKVATGGTTAILYDDDGDPYQVWTWNTSPSLDRKFVYESWNLLEELDALNSDAVINKFTWGLDLSGQNQNPSSNGGALPGLHAAGGIGGLLGMQTSGGTSYIYFYDANGNVMQLMRADANSLGARYELYPYGGELVATGTAATVNPFRFGTKYWDTESQMYYFGGRYLRSKIGRWMTRDPLGETDHGNVQCFVRNAPVNRVDPIGQCSQQPAGSLGGCSAKANALTKSDLFAHTIVLLIDLPGCPPPDICCQCCADPKAKGRFEKSTEQLTLCFGNWDAETLRHELWHAYQDCEAFSRPPGLPNSTCARASFREFQAYYLWSCDRAPDRCACAETGARASIPAPCLSDPTLGTAIVTTRRGHGCR